MGQKYLLKTRPTGGPRLGGFDPTPPACSPTPALLPRGQLRSLAVPAEAVGAAVQAEVLRANGGGALGPPLKAAGFKGIFVDF